MFVNDILSRAVGVRLMRETTLQASGIYARRDADRVINEKHRKALLAMAEFNGRTLTPALRRMGDDYALNVFGSLDYAPSLHFYTAVQGRFREGWMPENFYHHVVVPGIIKGLADISAKKSFSNLLLRSSALPDIAYHIDGIFYDRDYLPISRAAMIELARPHDAVFVKGDGSGRGEKVRKVPVAALADYRFSGDGVIQRPIRQHSFFDEFVTGSVATLRITTLKIPGGAIEMREARLRFGRRATEWLVAENDVTAQVIDKAGTLDRWGYTSDWRACEAHPDSGTAFAGRQIPSFSAAVAFCENLHAGLPHVAIIGWDVAINQDGEVELVEWNAGHCDIAGAEARIGPLFADMGWEKFVKKTRK